MDYRVRCQSAAWFKAAQRGEPIVVGFGGGLNSTALLVILHEMHVKPALILFADTGGELPVTYAHLQRMQAWCRGRWGMSIDVVKNDSPRAGYQSLEDECLRKKMLPSRAYGHSSCAEKWKIRPQNKALKAWKAAHGIPKTEKVWKLLGYDGGEQRRATIFEDDVCRYAYPLLDLDIDRDGCQAVCDRAGMHHVAGSACFYCPSSTKGEVIALSKEHPDLFRRAVEMEDLALSSGELVKIKGLGRHWSWRELVEADEKKRATMIDSPVESCTMCADIGRD